VRGHETQEANDAQETCSSAELPDLIAEGAGPIWEEHNRRMIALYRARDYAGAEEAAKLALDLATREAASCHPDLAASLNNLADIRNDLVTGMSVSAIARKFTTSRQTIMRFATRIHGRLAKQVVVDAIVKLPKRVLIAIPTKQLAGFGIWTPVKGIVFV
jgi:hypothetical protein